MKRHSLEGEIERIAGGVASGSPHRGAIVVDHRELNQKGELSAVSPEYVPMHKKQWPPRESEVAMCVSEIWPSIIIVNFCVKTRELSDASFDLFAIGVAYGVTDTPLNDWLFFKAPFSV